jgi:hypothetical protein
MTDSGHCINAEPLTSESLILPDEITVLAFRQRQTNRVQQSFREMVLEFALGYLSPKKCCVHIG